MSKFLGMCLDWRVFGGLAAIALGIWLYAPQFIGAALALLVLLVCPLSMAIMAWMMRGSMPMQGSSLAPAERLARLEQEQAHLSAEIARVRAEIDTPTVPAAIPAGERAEG